MNGDDQVTDPQAPAVVVTPLLQRDPLALAMFAAWVNLPSDRLPPEMRAHTCEQTAKAWERVATAVRSWLLSEERVEAAAKAHCDYFGGEGWWEIGLLADTLPEGRKAMIAALSSAIGQPETEFSGWVEVVEEGKQ